MGEFLLLVKVKKIYLYHNKVLDKQPKLLNLKTFIRKLIIIITIYCKTQIVQAI